MRANRLQTALKSLAEAIHEAEAALEEMRSEPDPLAVHIFVSRRQYRNMADTKGGKRHATGRPPAISAFLAALGDWERLMGAVAKR